MEKEPLTDKCARYLDMLCNQISERCVGSEGNRKATSFLEKEFSLLGWPVELQAFDAMDWKENGAVLRSGDEHFDVLVSPYSNGFKGEARLVSASTMNELENLQAAGCLLFPHGEIAKEQLMPKNFVFYNPEHHQKIVALLEKSGARAIISATGRDGAVAGGVYPFPLIEDGDFDIPSVYMTDVEGEKLKKHIGKTVYLESNSERIPGNGYNVIATRGKKGSKKIVITAHVDAKKGSPGAIDNATGVVVLLLFADMLKNYRGDKQIELVALNGEDYYAVPGQMTYIAANSGNFKDMILNINIDGAGYLKGPSAFSLFELPDEITSLAKEAIKRFPGIEEGALWPQGDHSIFLQYGVPAIAVSSKWFIDNIAIQDITHTSRDTTDIVNCRRLVEISTVLDWLIREL